jgi:hypothetical protein
VSVHAEYAGYVGNSLIYSARRPSYTCRMSPTVFREGPYRFFFFSREETRPHIHIGCPDGEAKYWITPAVAMAYNRGLSAKQLSQIAKIVEDHKHEISKAWQKHFDR